MITLSRKTKTAQGARTGHISAPSLSSISITPPRSSAWVQSLDTDSCRDAGGTPTSLVSARALNEEIPEKHDNVSIFVSSFDYRRRSCAPVGAQAQAESSVLGMKKNASTFSCISQNLIVLLQQNSKN